jgi:hypothetical protein
LQGLSRLGWFVSHTRGELAMTQGDVEMFSIYFREPWQVTLVIRPGRGSAMRAGFFGWEPTAPRVITATSTFHRLSGVIDAPARGDRGDSRAGFRTLPPPPASSLRAPRPTASVFEGSQYMPTPIPAERKKWPWLVGGLAVLAVLAFFGLQFYAPTAPPEALGLVMTEAQGQLQIQWSNSSKSIVRATKGTLTITDGTAVERVALTRGQISDGRYLYTRKGGDVEVRMEVEGSAGSLAESSRFFGRPPVAPTPIAETQAIEDERAALQAEVDRLKGQNAALSVRIQQLERTQRILEIRLGIPDKQ